MNVAERLLAGLFLLISTASLLRLLHERMRDTELSGRESLRELRDGAKWRETDGEDGVRNKCKLEETVCPYYHGFIIPPHYVHRP
jgi:hypothetical protein